MNLGSGKRFSNLFFFGAPLAVGVLILMVMVMTKKPPAREDDGDDVLPVRVSTVAMHYFEPSISGFGSVVPEKSWVARAEVAGKVVALNPQFRVGELVASGTLLMRLDSKEYALAVERQEAQLKSAKAQWANLEQEQANLKRTLTLEQQQLQLLTREFKRNLNLARDGSISETLMDQVEREMLRQKLQVTQLENSLALIPSRQDQIQAQISQAQSALEDAQRRLALTEVKMPFEGLIVGKQVEVGQAVTVGALLGEAQGIDRVEINAGMALEELLSLFDTPLLSAADSEMWLDRESLDQIKAQVRVTLGERIYTWSAKVSRLAPRLDSATRAMGVMVLVDRPFGEISESQNPALISGSFAEVSLKGPRREGIVIPRSALHANKVWLANDENRLEIRSVQKGIVMEDWVEIVSGLQNGDRVVLSDITPAVSGTLLEPVEDDRVSEARLQWGIAEQQP